MVDGYFVAFNAQASLAVNLPQATLGFVMVVSVNACTWTLQGHMRLQINPVGGYRMEACLLSFVDKIPLLHACAWTLQGYMRV